MAVSDLTNTTWVFDVGGVSYLNSTTYNITFTSNNAQYTSIKTQGNGEEFTLIYNNNAVYYYEEPVIGEWTNEAYRTIEITGGTDATNATLITWLEANATQQVVSTGKTQLGTRAITKKMFGTREITKEVVNGVVVYEKDTPSGYTINIIAGHEVTDATWGCNTYFKFNSNSVSTSDYDGYVSEYGVLTGPSTYTNVTSMAFVSTTNNMQQSSSVIYGSDSYHFSTSVVVIQINSSGNIYINGLENTGPQ